MALTVHPSGRTLQRPPDHRQQSLLAGGQAGEELPSTAEIPPIPGAVDQNSGRYCAGWGHRSNLGVHENPSASRRHGPYHVRRIRLTTPPWVGLPIKVNGFFYTTSANQPIPLIWPTSRSSGSQNLIVYTASVHLSRAGSTNPTHTRSGVNAPAEPGRSGSGGLLGAGVTRGGVRLSIIPKEPRYQQTRPRTSLNNRVTHPRP